MGWYSAWDASPFLCLFVVGGLGLAVCHPGCSALPLWHRAGSGLLIRDEMRNFTPE